MTKEYYTDFEQQIIDACRHKQPDLIRQCFHSLQRMPVFSMMRLQAYALHKTLTLEYGKSFKHSYPEKLVKNFYGRYKKATTIDAITLSKKAKRNLSDLELLKLDIKRNKSKYEKEIVFNILDITSYFNKIGQKFLDRYKLTVDEIKQELKPFADFANNKIKQDNAYIIRIKFEKIKINIFDVVKKALINDDKNTVKSQIFIKIDDYINTHIDDRELTQYELITRDAIRSEVLHFINENAAR
jgi:hypothetical protein